MKTRKFRIEETMFPKTRKIAAILLLLVLLPVMAMAQSVTVTADKSSYPQGETIVAKATVSGSGLSYTVFYLKNTTVSGSSPIQSSAPIYDTTTPKATFNTSALSPGTYYVYPVAYFSNSTMINNRYATITISQAENHYASAPSTSTAAVNFSKVSGTYIFINDPESLTKNHLGDHASGYGNKVLYRGNISGKTRLYAEFNNTTGEDIYYGYYFWNWSNKYVTIDVLSHGTSYGWEGRNTDTWQTWFSNGTFRLGGNSYSIAPNRGAWLFVGNPHFVYNSADPSQFISSALKITNGNTFDCALELLPSSEIQIDAVAFHNFAKIDGTSTSLTNNYDVTGVSDYNAVTGNLSWTIGNDATNEYILPVQGVQVENGKYWNSHNMSNPETLPLRLSNNTVAYNKFPNYGVIYTETLTFTNNSNADKTLEYYIRVHQTHHANGDEVRRSVGVNLPNDQQFLAFNFLKPGYTGWGTYNAWDSYGNDYQNIQPDKAVDRFIKKVTVPRNSTGTIVVEYVLGGQSSQPVQHFVKVVASANYKYDITASAGSNGSISPSGTQTINYAGNKTFYFYPDTGYEIDKVLVDGVNNTSAVSAGSYTFSNVAANHTISASFKQKAATTYTIGTSSSPSSGGTTSGGGTFTSGASCTVKASAHSGYAFTNWTVSGSVVSTSANYTFTVSTDRNLVANFTQTAPNGCTSGTQYPNSTFTPSCTGSNETISSNCWAGEYSVVSVTNGTSYSFSSSISSDYITIANSAGTTVLTTGTGSVTWTATSSTTIRFYTHTNSSCGTSETNRNRIVKCGTGSKLTLDNFTSNTTTISSLTQSFILTYSGLGNRTANSLSFKGGYALFNSNGSTEVAYAANRGYSYDNLPAYNGWWGDVAVSITLSDFALSSLPASGTYRIYPVYSETLSSPYRPYEFIKGTDGSDKYLTIAIPASLTVSPTSYNFTANGGNSSAIQVTSNVSWNASDDATWLSVSPTSGSNNGTFTMTASANTSTASRSATITVLGGGITRIVNITQAAGGSTTPDLQILSLSVNGTLRQNQTGSFNATLKNNGNGAYNSHLYIYLEKPYVYTPNQRIDGGIISIAAGASKTITVTGNITLPPDTYNCNMVYDANNNPSDMATYQFHNTLNVQATVYSNSTAIHEVQKEDFIIYPNPVKDELFIKSDLRVEKVEIYSLTGTLLLIENNFNEKVSLSTLPKGIYMVKLHTDKGMVIRKIMKK